MNSEPLLFFKNLNPYKVNAKYLQGYPNLNETFITRFIPLKDGVEFQNASDSEIKISLKRDQIVKINVEDQSSIENRVGFTRLLLVGIFALAWKKRETLPLSFLVIEYKNEFDENQEIYIQSESKSGYQDFTNIKYNLQKFWKEADDNPNYDTVIEETNKSYKIKKEEENNKTVTGCLVIIVIAIIFAIISAIK